MKRNLKNIVVIIGIIIVGVCSYFTMKDVQGNQISKNQTLELQELLGSNNNQNQQPEMSSSNREKTLTKQNGENDNSQLSKNRNAGKESDQTPPQMPNGNILGEKIEENMSNDRNRENSQSSQIKVVHYIMFGMEAFIITVFIMYLGISKFNKLTLKETFSGSNSLIVYSILTLIITIILVVIQTYITNAVFMDKNINNQNQVQMTKGQNE